MNDECIEKLCDIKKNLIEFICPIITDLEDVNTCELGEVVDIIKDLYQAEKYYYEAGYYKNHMAYYNNSHGNTDTAIATLKELWESSTPELKSKIKNDLTKLMDDMTI